MSDLEQRAIGVGSAAEVPAATPRHHRGRIPLSVWLAAGWVALIVLGAIFANVLPIHGYDEPVAGASSGPFQHWPQFLGTDQIGRSVLSRIVFGSRVSLAVCLLATVIGLGVGTLLGLAAAYFGGLVKAAISLISDAILAFPVLVLLLAVAAVITPSMWTLSVLLGLVSVPACQRIVAANASAQLGRDYVLAARVLGVPSWRLLFREVLPNIANSLLAFGFIMIALFMVFEGALDFLGAGIPPPRPSWGQMIAGGTPVLDSRPYLSLVPAAVLVLTVFAFNTLGDRLQERFDERRVNL